MTITTVFDPPLPSDNPATFNSKAFTLVGDLNDFATEANALAADVNAKQATASAAATTASTQAGNASTSASNAAASAAAAAASFDNFDDRYLGAKASNPTLDNDGNALLEGALYWNTTAKEMRAWNGTAWVTASAANSVSRSGDTMTGNLDFSGNGLRIRGEFSGATLADRTHFQNRNADSNTDVGLIPSGTGTVSVLSLFTNSDPTNATFGAVQSRTTDFRLTATRSGSGAYAPMTFWTSDIERFRINTNGRVQITPNNEVYGLQINYGATLNGHYLGGASDGSLVISTGGGAERLRIDTSGNVGIGVAPATKLDLYNTSTADTIAQVRNDTVSLQIQAGNNYTYINTFTADPMLFGTNNAERLRIDTSGNVLVTGSGGLGYGVGSGGTVTQATSKATSVSLNKPCGQITMNNAALNAGASVVFVCDNTSVGASDVVVGNIQLGSVTDAANYRLEVFASGTSGGARFAVRLTNVSGGSLSEAVVINFAIVKAATS